MKNKIYRTVSVEDRLPKHGGHFLSSIGLVRFMISDKEWVDDYYRTRNPDWWLEEVYFPSEDEMQNLYSLNRDFYDSSFAAGMHKGANFILNHIKGGGK